ncbi:Sickle tail protein like protein [Chelonia mydas]|uniref:Sickle tail protein like protein n=1 Tax=Chelonia mydas TaxID=8469 RepID=M7C8U9_CHEMY|nr:Sickle tail protein like protein [Chelonia mydas]
MGTARGKTSQPLCMRHAHTYLEWTWSNTSRRTTVMKGDQGKNNLHVTSLDDAECLRSKELLATGNNNTSNPKPTRNIPRRHTVGGPRSSKEILGMQTSEMDRKREAFLEHLKQKYPHHATAIMGHQERLRDQLKNQCIRTLDVLHYLIMQVKINLPLTNIDYQTPSTDKSGKATVPVLTQAVLVAQALPSPDLSELSADDELEGLTDQPSAPGTFETTKDLIELLVVSPLPYGENPLAPMPRVPSRGKPAMVCRSKTLSRHRSWSWSRSSPDSADSHLWGKPAMVCRSKTPSRHRSWSWSRSSPDSADSHLPAAQKEVAAPAAGRHEEALGRAHCFLAPPRDRHREELRQPSPEVYHRQSRSRECWHRSWSQGFQYHSQSCSARSCSFSCRRRLLALPWPSRSVSPAPAAIATRTGAQAAGTLRGAGNLNGGCQAIGPSGPPGPIRSAKGPCPGEVTRCSTPGPCTDARRCRRQQYPGLQHPPSLDRRVRHQAQCRPMDSCPGLSWGPLPREMGSRRTNQRGSSSS